MFLFALLLAATPTADEIIARHIEARGGAQKLAALQSVKVTGSGSKVTVASDLKAVTGALAAFALFGQRATQTFETVGKELGK